MSSEEYGFATQKGVDWTKYAAFRPPYPQSYFDEIFDYHARKSGAGWSVAHDVGAGAGIASAGLARRFGKVIVSDPNEGYMTAAHENLFTEGGLPESQFVFLKETAEVSSVEAGSVDLITACESIPYTDVAVAFEEFRRQLRPGGSVMVSYYTRPRILGNEAAAKAWNSLFQILCGKAENDVHLRAVAVADCGLTSIDVPEGKWRNVRRLFINAGGSLDSFKVWDKPRRESRIGNNEEIVWQENAPEWSDEREFQWFKGYIATWIPTVTEDEADGLWTDLDKALGGKKARIETPVAMVFATKRE